MHWKSGIFLKPQSLVLSKNYCRTNGRRAAVLGGTLQYTWEVWVSLSSRLRSQEGTAIQVADVLLFDLEVCRGNIGRVVRVGGS